MTHVMPLAEILATYADGDEIGWEAEFAYLRKHHSSKLEALTSSIREFGILMPINLGNDGRVWDGHHRLCVAHDLNFPRVPVTVTPS